VLWLQVPVKRLSGSDFVGGFFRAFSCSTIRCSHRQIWSNRFKNPVKELAYRFGKNPRLFSLFLLRSFSSNSDKFNILLRNSDVSFYRLACSHPQSLPWCINERPKPLSHHPVFKPKNVFSRFIEICIILGGSHIIFLVLSYFSSSLVCHPLTSHDAISGNRL